MFAHFTAAGLVPTEAATAATTTTATSIDATAVAATAAAATAAPVVPSDVIHFCVMCLNTRKTFDYGLRDSTSERVSQQPRLNPEKERKKPSVRRFALIFVLFL